MASSFQLVHSTTSLKNSIFFRRSRVLAFPLDLSPFSTSSAIFSSSILQAHKKSRQPAAGVKVCRDEIVKDNPTSNVPDSIFSKLGFDRRNNAIFSYFDTNYAKKFAKFENLCPIVSVKAYQVEIVGMPVGKLSTCKLLRRFLTHRLFSVASSLNEPIADSIFSDTHKSGSYTRGDSTFYSLIQHHAHSGDFKALELIFQRMKRENRAFSEKIFILVFKAYGKACLHRKAVELFNSMEDKYSCLPTVKSFNSLLNVIIQQGLYRDALEFYHYVLNDKKHISPNGLTFNLVIKSLCRLGLVGRAVDMFREMPAFHCKPDTYTYCTLMDGLCKEDRIDDAVALLDEMQIEGCDPTPPTFNVLINGLCKKGDLARAAKLVDNMFLKGCVPNEVTYNTLIHGLCLRGKLDKAVSLLSRMLSNKLKPNDITYGTIINGLVKKGPATDALNMLLGMEERGYAPNEYAYSAIISGLFREGKSDEALKLWAKMLEKGCKPNTVVYSVVIDGLCQDGKPHEAEEYFSQMIDAGCLPNAHTYSSLMKGFFQVGDCDKAVLLWKDMVEKDYMDNEVCYSVLIHGFCKNGKLENALVIWKQVLAKGLTPDVVAYSSMIHGLCNVGLVEQGLSLFNEMLYKASDSKPDVITYNIIIHALCKQGSITHAMDILNRMLSEGCDPDSVTCKFFLTAFREKLDPPLDGGEFLDELVLRLQKCDRIIGASNIVQVMLQNFLQPKASTWDKVIRGICKPKRTEAAINKCWGDLFF
ncbi:pentatricopeptide repeat-containing protein At4g20090 isoform X1 [Salvia hispanica]|uniref:pentatricopeptide repeat-containing protein At4g20090 isoform X1 n=1 Tax=Salvia hispanica TaxID=49212 RepID=UPI002009D4C9|nr:pentatricopeptide repeat-containing protein At4g20090 isoform X1 [Salvia hispanica]XP_047972964.1 pentatricopeptide repeat-containing protein At4g20090 isoform X1 [Salvia hispanica]XP_047972965.1 pentatricopeptide repeat-containing protein At4g20090 isoform X1 [Salvia hispanica]